jgi:cell division protein FtsI/penicillin-binding protein 2
MTPVSSRLRSRLWVVVALLALCTAGLIGRLADLQLAQHSRYEVLAADEHAVRETLPAPRGPILDRNGYPLALSIDAYTVQVDPRLWETPAVAQPAAAALGAALGQSPAALLDQVQKAGGRNVVVARNVPYATGRTLEAQALPGVVLVQGQERLYPEGDLASNVLGFLGADGNGLVGIEQDANAVLAGTPGLSVYQQDALGNPIGSAQSTEQAAQPGGAVQLTIDRQVQQIVEQHLDASIAQTGASGGSAIAMDPQTGAILALASRPSFGETTLNLSDPAQAQLYRDRAVTDLYEPGSTFKLITMSAAIDSGIVNANSTYLDTGTFRIGDVAIHNWDLSAHGPTTMTTVIVDSLNTGAAWVSQKLGAQRFYDYVHRFGFGTPTGVGLGGEAAGQMRTPGQPGWTTVDLATNSYGQGISATPLQMITGIAAVINGGKLMRPYIIQSESGPDGTKVTEPTVVRQVVSPETSATLRQMMAEELKAYTLAQVPGYSGGGKSGTAYISGARGYAAERTIPSYVEYVPAENPRLLLLVKLDNLGTNDLGGQLAAPLARDILEQVLPVLGIPPDTKTAKTP